MFDFGDELTIQSYRIPWLIWIQILVLFLIIFLFYCFSSSTPSPDDPSLSSAASPDSSSSSYRRDSDEKEMIVKSGGVGGDTSTTVSDYVRHCQVTRSRSIKGEMAMTTTTGRRIVREETAEGDTVTNYHPCNYISLAKLVFLKCFGLDCELERSSSPKKKKRK